MTETPNWPGKTDTPPGGAPPYQPGYPGGYPPGGPPHPYAYPPGPYPGSYPAPPMPYGDYSPPPAPPRNGLGIAALVVGVIAVVSSFSVVGGVVLGVAAVVLGLLGRGRVKRGEADNGGVALAGSVLGVLAIVAGLAFIAIWVGFFNKVGAGDYFDCLQQAGQDRTKVQQCSDEFRQSVENRLTVTATPTP